MYSPPDVFHRFAQRFRRFRRGIPHTFCQHLSVPLRWRVPLGITPKRGPKQFQCETLFVLSQTANQRFNRHGLTLQAHLTRDNPISREFLVLRSIGRSHRLGQSLAPTRPHVWQVILGIPEPKVEHHEGHGIRTCPISSELRPILDEAFEIFGDKSEYVVAAPQYRAAANTAMGWKNSNLRTELTRLLRRAGVSSWPRLFHSMRASRQTELQREFPLHVVCSWLGNSRRIAQQSYLLVTEDDFAKAAGELGRPNECSSTV